MQRSYGISPGDYRNTCTSVDGTTLVLVACFLVLWVTSLFAMIASIIHFQILGALGFFVLMAIC